IENHSWTNKFYSILLKWIVYLLLPNMLHSKLPILLHSYFPFTKDLESGIFVKYTPFSLPIGITITNHLQALQAANFHEAEHYGIILSYLKLLN
ncbi:MAG: hypothetical protein WBB63_08150, partial [Sphingobacterium thalpophilum]